MLAVIPLLLLSPAAGAPVDVAPFGTPLPGEVGVFWEDPREVHRVVVRFKGEAPPAESVRLEYWGSRWPEQHLPKDKPVGSGGSGWWEMGNWYNGGWRQADAECREEGSELTFTFRPVNAKEFPKVEGYPAEFRYTLKLRITSSGKLPKVEALHAFTDSTWERKSVRLLFREDRAADPKLEGFNAAVESMDRASPREFRLNLWSAHNADPNTFDQPLVTVTGRSGFTFAVSDLAQGPILVPHLGAAVLAGNDARAYAAVMEAGKAQAGRSLYDRISGLPERTWRAAWGEMPPKKSLIYIPLQLDGGRQHFKLSADGSVEYREGTHFIQGLEGADTPRVKADVPRVRFEFGLSGRPDSRSLVEGALPLCESEWTLPGGKLKQTALVTELAGTKADGPVPAGDTLAVLLMRFVASNPGEKPARVSLPLRCGEDDAVGKLRIDEQGLLWSGDRLRGQWVADTKPRAEGDSLTWEVELAPGTSSELLLKLPYLSPEGDAEKQQLAALDYAREREAVAGYWRRRLDAGAKLITPEPMLNNYYRAHASHLLANSELEPGADRRFARVGSFSYGAYGNESCMMVVDLDRRGLHEEARECLEAWLRYQGTVALPGDFSTKEGVLYGAAGYESGGYNQHHGWILWCLAEHYRFTRDTDWLRHAAPGILKGAEWIIGERARTLKRKDLAKGLLPAGSLEDIGDWWPWLSTNCYTWRGLDAAAWALEQIQHPEAARLRKEADDYHKALLAAFRAAALRTPVVRLRDGTSVPHFPSQPFRRGRSYGWICETLEGALHLLITRALDPHSPEAAWILRDYEDNLYLSSQYGYTVPDFDKQWFGLGGISMQACLLLDVEPYLYRDDVKQALRPLFNGIAVGYFPDVQMLTEHALPEMGDWTGDHFKSSDEANAAGWLRYLFVREEGDELLYGQAIPREWLKPGQRCGIERAATYFGPTSVLYEASRDGITAHLDPPTRNRPKALRLRFRHPDGKLLESVTVNGKPWKRLKDDWVLLPADLPPSTTITARWEQ
jgi:hypothetical protein